MPSKFCRGEELYEKDSLFSKLALSLILLVLTCWLEGDNDRKFKSHS